MVFVNIPALFIVPPTEVRVELVLSKVFENAVLAVKVKVPLIVAFGALANTIVLTFVPVDPKFKVLPASMAKSFY